MNCHQCLSDNLYDFPFCSFSCRTTYLTRLENSAFKDGDYRKEKIHPEMFDELNKFYLEPNRYPDPKIKPLSEKFFISRKQFLN